MGNRVLQETPLSLWGLNARLKTTLLELDGELRVVQSSCQDPYMLRCVPEEVNGRHVGDVLRTEAAEVVQRLIVALLETDESFHAETGMSLQSQEQLAVWDICLSRLSGVGWIVMLRDVTELAQARMREDAYVQRLRDLAVELERTADAERLILATELHDRVSQPLAAARLRLEEHHRLHRDIDIARREEHHQRIMSLIDDAIVESRAMIAGLAPPTLYELGLKAALETLVDDVEGRGLACKARLDVPAGVQIEQAVAAFVFRGVRELLVNVWRHAGAQSVRVDVAVEACWLRAMVEDDGHGFDLEVPTATHGGARGGFGLFSIREHVDRLGGEFQVESRAGEGTRISFEVPLCSGE